jgi:hypothetical protein
MAFGFPAYHTETIELAASRQAAREAVIYVFDALEWRYEFLHPDLYRVVRPMNPFTWGETVTVSLETPGVVVIESKCVFPLQIIDWGANKRNVPTFVERFTLKSTRDLKIGGEEPIAFDKRGRTPLDRVLNEDEGPSI